MEPGNGNRAQARSPHLQRPLLVSPARGALGVRELNLINYHKADTCHLREKNQIVLDKLTRIGEWMS